MGSGIDGGGEHANRSRAQRFAGVRRARKARCKACGRGNACKRHKLDDGMLVVKVCRYCGHEEAVQDVWGILDEAARSQKEVP